MLQLKHVDEAIARRHEVDRLYRQGLEGVKGLFIHAMTVTARYNYSCFPVLVDPEYLLTRDALYEKLKSQRISHGVFSIH